MSGGIRFVIGALATWRLTHLLVEEDGPGDVVVRVRQRLGDGPLGELMDCFACASVWVAGPIGLVVAERRRDAPLAALALSGAACLLERVGREPPAELDLLAFDVDGDAYGSEFDEPGVR